MAHFPALFLFSLSPTLSGYSVDANVATVECGSLSVSHSRISVALLPIDRRLLHGINLIGLVKRHCEGEAGT